MSKKYSFDDHPEHKARLGEWQDKWIANAMNCAPMTDEEKKQYSAAARGLYRAAQLPEPQAVVFANGPVSGAIAAGVAAGVWYLRDNPEKHIKLFGRRLAESDLVAAIPVACRFATGAAINSLFGTSMPLPPIDTAIDATYDATDAAAHNATDAVARTAAHAATYDAHAAATYAATDAATADEYAAVYAATNAGTYAAAYTAADDEYAATNAAAIAAMNAAARDDAEAATYAAHTLRTYAATVTADTYDAVYAAMYAITYAATNAALCAATNATAAASYAVDDVAARAATNTATTAAAATDGGVASFLVRCTAYAHRLRDGGNQWSGRVSYLSFFRHVAKLDLDYSKFRHYETLAHAGPRYTHERFVVISERPEWIKIDDRRLPHSPVGPSHRWRDGFALYYWHGTSVPAAWIESPNTVDPKIALTWPNIEQRRACVEIIGWKRILDQLQPTIIDVDADPEIGVLLEVELPESGKARFLKVQCGTKREFVLSVPVEMQTARGANAWTYGIEPDELQLEVRT